MKTPIEVKDFITEKFKSVSRFAALVGKNSTQLHNLFKNQNASARSEEIYNLAVETEDRATKNEIQPEEREALEKFIKEKYNGNNSAFSRATGSDLMKVSNILNGHSIRKSPQVKHVFKKAGISTKKNPPKNS